MRFFSAWFFPSCVTRTIWNPGVRFAPESVENSTSARDPTIRLRDSHGVSPRFTAHLAVNNISLPINPWNCHGNYPL